MLGVVLFSNGGGMGKGKFRFWLFFFKFRLFVFLCYVFVKLIYCFLVLLYCVMRWVFDCCVSEELLIFFSESGVFGSIFLMFFELVSVCKW